MKKFLMIDYNRHVPVFGRIEQDVICAFGMADEGDYAIAQAICVIYYSVNIVNFFVVFS